MKRFNSEVEVMREIHCSEERAIITCMRIFRSCGIHKVVLVNSSISVIFKDTRICKCTNVQRELIGEWKNEPVYRDVCMDCKVVIDENAYNQEVEMENKLEESLI